MKLGKSKSFRILDDHDRRIRDIDSNLDDGRRNENLNLTSLEALHDLIFLLRLHPTVEKAQPDRREYSALEMLELDRGCFEIDFFGFLDERKYDVHLASLPDLLFHKVVYLVFLIFKADSGFDGFSVSGHLIDD